MKWTDVREKYPNTFIKLKSLKSHIDNNIEIFDDVAVIDIVPNELATKELANCSGDVFIYHTANENLTMEVVNAPTLRRRF
ncbi:MAG: hypothetical protein ACRCWG_11750 [Sarcina sp.]